MRQVTEIAALNRVIVLVGEKAGFDPLELTNYLYETGDQQPVHLLRYLENKHSTQSRQCNHPPQRWCSVVSATWNALPA